MRRHMKIEIVGFYKNLDPKFKIIGTLHVYLVDLDLDIRGIAVHKAGKLWFYKIPGRNCIDSETKEKVWFPYISFSNKETNEDIAI